MDTTGNAIENLWRVGNVSRVEEFQEENKTSLEDLKGLRFGEPEKIGSVMQGKKTEVDDVTVEPLNFLVFGYGINLQKTIIIVLLKYLVLQR